MQAGNCRVRGHAFLAVSVLAVLFLGAAGSASAQSQAINGTIEGKVTDTSGAVLPGVTVTITNVATNTTRSFVTDDRGEYRAPLLPLGNYRVRIELSGFKTVDRSGLTLSAGQTAVVNAVLEVGAVEETVQVVAEAAVADPARIDLGRTIAAAEVQNLPSVARNPYNFALLQPNVTGYDNEEFGATRVNANGSQMRTNYQIDGSSATQKNRAGLRMFQPTDIMIQEVKVITNGFAPEFGQTTGMVYNTITPSGTNAFHGQANYRFRRKGFSAKPKNVVVFSPGTDKPDTRVDNVSGAVGGPIARDKVFFYAGYEWLKNDLSANRVITVTPATAQVLGLSSEAIGEGVIPAIQEVNVFIGKVDAQLGAANRLSGRWSLFNNKTPENIAGGLNTRENSVDFQDRMDSVSLQLTSTIGNSMLNELRVAYGRRDNPQTPSPVAGPGPVIQVQGAANFGGAPPPGTALTPFEFTEDYWQIVNNVSWIRGSHNFKAGLDVQFIDDHRENDLVPQYVFATTAAYLAAKSGANPFSYTQFRQGLGDPTVSYSQSYYSFFVQDDWRLRDNLKLLYGLRYDVFKVPEADPDAPYGPSRDFRVDKNNIAPRVGIAWTLGQAQRTVVRASTGMMYEPPLGAFYEDALLESGSPKLLTVNVTPTSVGAPAFPGTLATLPPGVVPSQSIRAVASDFDTQYAWLSNFQVEHALTSDLSVSVGYVNSTGRSLPLLYNSNCVAGATTLGDGRPICGAARVDPNFDRILEVRSTGTSQYNALTASVNKRFSEGWLVQASYTLSKAEDDGVIGSRYVIGSTDAPGISDPFDQERDYAYTSWNTTHSLSVSAVINPRFEGDGMWNAVANNNQVSVIVLANSGLPFNIISNGDRNADGISADRPTGIERNSGELGTYVNVDFRYSRFIPIRGDMRGEVFFETRNLFNRFNVRQVGGGSPTIATDPAANPLAPIPTEVCSIDTRTGCFPVTQTYDARQAQIGFKFLF